MEYLYLREEPMPREELKALVIKIHEAEERGDFREAEILETQMPFDDYLVSFFKPLIGEEAYKASITELKEYINEEHKKVLQKYSAI